MSISRLMQMGAAGAGGAPYWIALLGGTGVDEAEAVAIDSADNIIVAGYTDSDGAGDDDFLIAKYDSSGTLQWSRTLGGSGLDRAEAVAIDSADNIIVAGSTNSFGPGADNLFVAKCNSSGTLQWARTLGFNITDRATAVAIDSADNIIAAGLTNSDGAGGIDGLVAKYNSAGTLQWDRTLGRSSTNTGEVFLAVAIDSADNIILGGYVDSTSGRSLDLFVAKYTSSGGLLWVKNLGGSGSDIASAVAIDSADNIIVAGSTSSDGAGSSDFLIAKYSSSGVLQWDRTLGGISSDGAASVAIDSADNIIVAGSTSSDGAGDDDFLIAKYDSSGTLQWSRTLGGTGDDRDNGVAIDSADNIIVAGYTDSDGAGLDDLLIAKLPPDGSGTGTYGSLTYEEAVLTDAPAVLTSVFLSFTDAPAVLVTGTASPVDAPAVLTEELIRITP